MESGSWMDGNKLYDGQVIDRIELSLGAGSLSFRAPPERSVEVEAEAAAAQTAIELIGKDRPGLLSEVFAVLTDLKCNIVSSEVWTHDARMAALVHVTDADTLGAIDDQDRLDTVKRLLRHLLRGGGAGARDRKATARAAIPAPRRDGAAAHAPRRLHQMMHDDRAAAAPQPSSSSGDGGGRGRPVVEVVDCAERGYTLVNVRCRDRPKLLFDTVCTLTDMQYVVFHGTVIAEGSEAYQEYYIRHLDDSPVTSGDERDRLGRCLEAAIQRRNTEQGLRLELYCEDRVGLLSDVTRIFREHGLSVTHAEVATRGARAANVFYVVAASGEPVEAHAVEAVRAEIGEQVLFVREDAGGGEPRSPPGRDRRSLGNMIRSRSEKFLYNLGLIRSCS
ncbi:ACT domain-containing protein ACR5 isoform X3 [Oryza sativa Japonica Group]|uniref:ACT domain-containing protein ACR5 isoform X3 n=1 Tax=Oryza sativa subsp. japonica TaxID=39947 RepID=UPI00339D03C5